MKANELRIGNWVSFVSDDNFCKVSSIVDDLEFVCLISTNISSERGVDDYNPIPLTEEWLLKFGFKKDWCFRFNKHETRSVDGVNYIYWIDSSYITKIKHVHQLQNLYFVLTGEELETL